MLVAFYLPIRTAGNPVRRLYASTFNRPKAAIMKHEFRNMCVVKKRAVPLVVKSPAAPGAKWRQFDSICFPLCTFGN